MKQKLIYQTYWKRKIDVAISIIALPLLLPMMALISIALLLEGEGPILFSQVRLGKDQKKFVIYKFRTLVIDQTQGNKRVISGKDSRITKVGGFLRRTSLDELPQLINILKGDMSIIGPRPVLEEEWMPFQNRKGYDKRFAVRPGLCCTVDMKDRARASRKKQFIMDAWYVDKQSLCLDLKVFLFTMITVLLQKNVYRDSTVESPVPNRTKDSRKDESLGVK